MKFFRKFLTPKWFKKLDHFLLIRHAILWETRLHYFSILLICSIFLIFISTIILEFITQKSIDPALPGLLAIISIIISSIFLYYFYKQSQIKRLYKKNEYFRLISAYLIISISFASIVLIIPLLQLFKNVIINDLNTTLQTINISKFIIMFSIFATFNVFCMIITLIAKLNSFKTFFSILSVGILLDLLGLILGISIYAILIFVLYLFVCIFLFYQKKFKMKLITLYWILTISLLTFYFTIFSVIVYKPTEFKEFRGLYYAINYIFLISIIISQYFVVNQYYCLPKK